MKEKEILCAHVFFSNNDAVFFESNQQRKHEKCEYESGYNARPLKDAETLSGSRKILSRGLLRNLLLDQPPLASGCVFA